VMRGPRAAAARRRGVVTMPVMKGATSDGTGASTAGGEGAHHGLCLPECPINAPRRAGSRQGRRQRQQHSQGTSWCRTLEGQSGGGPLGDAVLSIPRRRPNAQRTSSSGCPNGWHLQLVLAT
jgi:hypothetical protein